MSELIPVENLPYLDSDGFRLHWGSNTTLLVEDGQCRSDTNISDIAITTANAAGTTINAAVNGLNGLDTGSLGASKDYFLFAIASQLGKPSGFILSLSRTAPLLPQDYVAKRLIRVWKSNGSSQLIKGSTAGNGKVITHFFDTAIEVLNAGTSDALAEIDLSAALPKLHGMPTRLKVDFTPASAGNAASFFELGSIATVGESLSGSVAAVVQRGSVEVLSKLDDSDSDKPKCQYINSAAACNTQVFVTSFEYYI